MTSGKGITETIPIALGENGELDFQQAMEDAGIMLDDLQGETSIDIGSNELFGSGKMMLSISKPMPLGERNEYGVRFEAESKGQLEKTIELMIRRSIAESFSRQLFLYSRNENHFRILIGIYGKKNGSSVDEHLNEQ